jgi:hypothetical protein
MAQFFIYILMQDSSPVGYVDICFVEGIQLSPKGRYEQFNRRYPGLINRVKLKYVAAFLGISIYTLSRVRAKK